MELLLLWALTYALVHAGRQTWRHGKAAVLGRPLPPRPPAPGLADSAAAGVEAAAGGAARAAGSIWQAAGDGWRAGWTEGRTTRAARGRWRPWDTPDPTSPPHTTTTTPPRRDHPRRPGRPAGAKDSSRAHRGAWWSREAAAERRRWRDTPAPEPDAAADPTTEAPDLDSVPRCWSDLTGVQQQRVAAAAREEWGRDWADLTLAQAATAVRTLINVWYGAYPYLDDDDVLAAQAGRDDPTWRTGPTPTGTSTSDRPAPAAEPRRGGGDDDVIDAEIVTPRCWSDLTGEEQDQVVAAARDRYGRDWADLTVDQAAGVVRDWINTRYRVDLHADDVFAAQRGRDDPTWLTGPAPQNPTSSTALVAPDPAASAAGTPLEGDPLMATGSGETTNIQSARTYYEQLSAHATNDIASRIELSRTYMTAAQLSDQGVLSAIAHAQETAGLLAAAAAGVVQALEAHRLMEEAVASTPGAANTGFYRPV